MKWVKRIVFAILAILALFVGVVVVRTAMVRPEAGSASPANLAPPPDIHLGLHAAPLGEALRGHQDVVPVEAGTEDDWEAPPFAGEIRDGYVYGRGAIDDKGSIVAIME